MVVKLSGDVKDLKYLGEFLCRALMDNKAERQRIFEVRESVGEKNLDGTFEVDIPVSTLNGCTSWSGESGFFHWRDDVEQK